MIYKRDGGESSQIDRCISKPCPSSSTGDTLEKNVPLKTRTLIASRPIFDPNPDHIFSRGTVFFSKIFNNVKY